MPPLPPSRPQGERPGQGRTDPVARQLSRWRAVASHRVEQLPPAWRSRRRLTLVAAVVLGVLFLVYLLRPTPAPPPQVPPGTHVFQVSDRPVLVFAHSAGSVHISAGPDGQVSIAENRNGITDAIQTNYAQKGNTITVTVTIPDGLYLDTWVDFDVHVPRHAGASAELAAGTLNADGFSGRIALNNTNGAIWATNLTGDITLTTQSGSINTDHVRGRLTASTQNGTITTGDTRLSGRSTVQAQSGTINFHGSLDPNGSYIFRDSNGAIGLTLPRRSALQVDARSTSGSISSQFPGVRAVPQTGGSAARGSLGRTPRGQLTIQSSSGSIQLLQGD